ncbi:MAG TPA: PAS domain S-box protein, partial [Bacteroidia bacterium]|nr:PAS domain S-box protein [Bacteroidia bacterium]
MNKKTNPSAVPSGAMENRLSEFVIDSLPGLFYLYDDTGKFIHWNRNFETVSGYTGAEISGMHPLQFFDEPEKEELAEKIAEVFEKGEAFLETWFFTKDKKRIPYYFNGYSITYADKRCLIGVGIDITEKVEAEKLRRESQSQLQQTEQTLRKLNRELFLLNSANRVVFKATEEQALLDDLCKLLVDEGEYRMCWVGLVPEKDNEVRIITPQSMAGAGKERGREIRIDLNDAEARKGPAARAILSGKQMVVNHIARESEDERWKAAAAWYGFESSVSFPLVIDQLVAVSLNVYSSNTNSFDADEVKMLGAIADNLAYALTGIRNARNKKLAEQKLRYNEENLSLIFTSTHDIIFLLSREDGGRFKFISVNESFLKTTGLKADQVQGKYLDEVIPPSSLPLVLEKYETAIRTQQPLQWEETSPYPSGTKTGIVTITPVSDEHGSVTR